MAIRSALSVSLAAVLLSTVVGCGGESDFTPQPPAPAPPAPSSDAQGGPGLATTPAAPPPAPPMCAEATGTYTATREPSNVLFLIDRSGSMHIQLPSGDTRWGATEKGLFGLLGALPSTTQAGVMMFPQGDAPVNAYCGIDPAINDVRCHASWPEPSQTARCSTSTYTVGVASSALDPVQVKAIEDEVKASDAGFYWGTPSSTALTAAITAQRASTKPGARSVILLTDGNPTSCDQVGISNDISHVVDAATDGVTGGTLVRTFVIGVVDAAKQAAKADNLSPVAVAGGTKRYPGCEATNDCFYPVTSATFASDLGKVFDEISLQAFDCTFNLPQASADTDPTKINVQVGGASVPRDAAHQNGWDYLPNHTQIQLYGQACTDMKSASAKLDVVLGCKTILAAEYVTR